MRIIAIIFGILAAIVDLILVIVSIAVPEVYKIFGKEVTT